MYSTFHRGMTDEPDLFQFDRRNYRKSIRRASQDVKEGYDQTFTDVTSYVATNADTRVIFCGMGGSGIAPKLLNAYLDRHILTVQEYEFPFELRGNDLVIISTYSGNTEEVVSCYRKARRENANVIVVSTGGRIAEGIERTRIPFIDLPRNMQPRAALYYTFFTFLSLLESLNLTGHHARTVDDVRAYLQTHDLETYGRNLAENAFEKIPVIYTSTRYEPVAYRWRTQLNENAKTLAIHNVLPEANHNELMGLRNIALDSHFYLLAMDEDHNRVRKRFSITKKHVRKQDHTASEIRFKGERLVKMFSAILLGDWVSYYLALLYGSDPSDISEIETFKEDLGKFI